MSGSKIHATLAVLGYTFSNIEIRVTNNPVQPYPRIGLREPLNPHGENHWNHGGFRWFPSKTKQHQSNQSCFHHFPVVRNTDEHYDGEITSISWARIPNIMLVYPACLSHSVILKHLVQVVKQVPKVHLDYIERVVEAVDLPMLLDVVWLVGWLTDLNGTDPVVWLV